MNKHGILKTKDIKEKSIKVENPIKIQDVSLRDGHQSIFATRLRTEDLIPISEMMDEVGFHSLEVWGGATFDSMHRYLNEDPWERLKTLKKYIKKTPVSMLLRGQNLVGYRNYSDDVVVAFIEKAVEKGVDIFRVFDALNDYRNIIKAAEIIKKNNKIFQGTICYSLTEMRLGGEVYTVDYFLNKAKELKDMGADSICIKDMAGLIAPYDAYDLIIALKKEINLPLHLHTHFTSGMGDLTILKAIEAGVDIVDTCMAPFAYRTSHAAVEPLVVTLMGTNRETGFDLELLAKISAEMEKFIPKYLRYANNSKFSIIDTNVILHQTPGGMLSNLVNQLSQLDALDKLDEVFKELPNVRKALGMIPLVTPTSQIVGTQTVNNVLFDKNEKFSKITEQVKDLCYGLYGETTKAIDSELQKKALKGYSRGETAIKCRPGDILEPELSKIYSNFESLAKSEEDYILCALYPITGKRFLEWKYGLKEVPEDVKPITLEKINMEKEILAKAIQGEMIKMKKDEPKKSDNLRTFDVYVDGEYFKVEVGEQGIPTIANSVESSVNKPVPVKPKKIIKSNANEQIVIAPLPGLIVEINVKVGDKVKSGDTIVVLEAMKMLNSLKSEIDGKVVSINVDEGSSVQKDDILVVLEKNN